MKRFALILTALLSLTSVSGDTLTCRGVASSEFHVKATMHSFTGTTGDIDFSAYGVTDTSEGDTSLFMEIKVPVKNMKTGKEKRDNNMYSMFEYEKHPYITVNVKSVSINSIRPDKNRTGKIPFYLKIRDIQNPQTAEVNGWKENQKGISFTALFKVSLKTYNLKVPSPLPGVITVDDIVDLKADVKITK